VNIFVLTPGIKQLPQNDFHLASGEGDVVYLTNPLFQTKLFSSRRATIVSDDDLSRNDDDFADIVQRAHFLSQNWFGNALLARDLSYQGLNLGALFTRELAYYFIALQSACYLYGKLLDRWCPDRFIVIGDGSAWSYAAQLEAKRRGISCRIVEEGPAARVGRHRKAALFLEFVSGLIVRSQLKRAPKSGVLYSSAMKYVRPMLQRSRGDYFLREGFSWKVFIKSLRRPFFHLTVGPLQGPKSGQLDPDRVFGTLDGYAKNSGFFKMGDQDLWEAASPFFRQLIHKKMVHATRLVDVFMRILKELNPRAVVVDEDVILFNKALVLCARGLGIPTFTMMHGVPYKKDGNIPSNADYILAWGSSTKQRLLGWGLDPEKVVEVGAPQFVSYPKMRRNLSRERIENDFKIPLGSPLLVFAVMRLHTNEHPYPIYSRNSMFQTILHDTLDLIYGYASEHPDIYLVIKFHPGEKNSWFARQMADALPSQARQRIRFVQAYPIEELVSAADLVLTTPSTVYFEGLLLNTPVMLVDYPDKRYGAFITHDYLDIYERKTTYGRMDRLLSLQGRADRLAEQAAEIKINFFQSNENAVENVLSLLK
jgi:hypothetical protein